MKTIQANEMSDEQWKSFAKLDNFLYRKIYPQQWDDKDSDWQELKKNSLKNINVSDVSFSNDYYIFDDNNAVAYIKSFERRGNLYFDFNCFGEIITEESLKIILNDINRLLKERNKKEAFFYSFYERHYEPVLKTGAEIYDETLTSRLSKTNIDFSNLRRIVDSNKIGKNYEIKLFHEIPEEIHDRFVKYMNEVTIDSNFYHPKKKIMKEYTMKDLLDRVQDIKEDACPFYMYMLFDNKNIVGHCSVFIDIKNNKHWIDHEGAGYTSVGRNYRGKNLAKYLKAKMYLKIQEDYPDFEYILTDTFSWNKYMYRINEEFGFRPYQKGYTFQFTKEFLEKFLK
ncbi:MAG: GNAT family N-acetyltransferase [Bacteroidota bacterium]|nr:GNAT family N-acetyltransferase [Bacteroidota bacterium]